MGKELARRTARAELQRMVAEGGRMGLVNLLPTPHDPSRFNLWGDDLNTFLLVSHNIDGTLKSTGALPAGGTAGEVLGKLSSADGDYGLFEPALASNDVPHVPAGAGFQGISSSYMRADAYPPASGSADTVLGTRIYVPPVTATGYQIGSTPQSVSLFAAPFRNQTNVFPIKLTRDVTGFIGVHTNAAGSSDCVLYCGLWNPHATLDKAGTQVDIFGVTNPAGPADLFSTSQVSLQGGKTYWWGVWSTGTTPPTCVTMQLTEKLTSQGWNDNVKYDSMSWRYTLATSTTDLTAASPLTGDAVSAQHSAFQLKVA